MSVKYLFESLTEKFNNLTINSKSSRNELAISEGYKNKKLVVNFLGEDAFVSLGRNANIQGVITVNNKAKVHIGDNFASTGGVTIICRDDCEVKIGDDCMFATSVLIRTSDEHSIIDLDTGSVLNKNKDVTVGDHVWICDNVLILKGSCIGNGSVIGARSLVSSKIPENSLSVGSPAKVIKKNIGWEKTRPPK